MAWMADVGAGRVTIKESEADKSGSPDRRSLFDRNFRTKNVLGKCPPLRLFAPRLPLWLRSALESQP